MDRTKEGFSGPRSPALPEGDSPHEDHGGLQGRLGKGPPQQDGGCVPTCLCLCGRAGGQWSCAPRQPAQTQAGASAGGGGGLKQ